jgi:hypothetical protein
MRKVVFIMICDAQREARRCRTEVAQPCGDAPACRQSPARSVAGFLGESVGTFWYNSRRDHRRTDQRHVDHRELYPDIGELRRRAPVHASGAALKPRRRKTRRVRQYTDRRDVDDLAYRLARHMRQRIVIRRRR